MLGPFLAASAGFLHTIYIAINYKQRRLGHKARIVPQSSFRKIHVSWVYTPYVITINNVKTYTDRVVWMVATLCFHAGPQNRKDFLTHVSDTVQKRTWHNAVFFACFYERTGYEILNYYMLEIAPWLRLANICCTHAHSASIAGWLKLFANNLA